jgi:hypothetical protein
MAPGRADPPSTPDPSVTTTPPPATSTSPAVTTSKSPQARQLLAPAVRLSGDHGAPGTTFSATATGSAPCRWESITLEWDSDPPVTPTVDVDKGTATANFTVPAKADTGPHKVSATCNGDAYVSTPFTVVEKPSLTIDPDKGPPGSRLKATGTGFACGDDTDTVELTLDSEEVLGEGSSGRFSEQVTVPPAASVGDHTVEASCGNHPDITDHQTFTVTSTVTTTVPEPKPAALTLNPSSGRPGDPVNVNGERFVCADHSTTVEVLWDGTRLSIGSLDASGDFTVSFSIRADADMGAHTVRAVCLDGSTPVATDFTVTIPGKRTSVPTTSVTDTTETTDLASYWWVPVLIAVAVALLGAVHHRSNRPRPRKAPAVHAVSRLGGPPLVTVHEIPAPGEYTHALRLETHSGARTLTIEEVNDGPTHTE